MLRRCIISFLLKLWTSIKSIAAVYVTLWLYLWCSESMFEASKAAALPLNIAICASAFVLLHTFHFRRIKSEDEVQKGSVAYGLTLCAFALIIVAACIAL